eukprot:TRINITY_DN45860_c0_g1_i1.p1 TRINITY_DN45860_c0_g1~~TRINITY_DN45860_c0_g1_i1.p1  ORF type:complete len:142 (+),score=34.14 TRINITY_DN45860_c0_g1_i1:78-503(+)
MAEKTPVKRRREISLEEFAKHNTPNDCWIAVHGLVLDLPRDFLDEHPGGPDVITVLAGMDSSSDFEDVAHSDSARVWADKYIIGYLAGTPEENKTKLLSDIKFGSAAGPIGGGDAGMVANLLPVAAVAVASIAVYLFLRKK